jgi:hypothetical protein
MDIEYIEDADEAQWITVKRKPTQKPKLFNRELESVPIDTDQILKKKERRPRSRSKVKSFRGKLMKHPNEMNFAKISDYLAYKRKWNDAQLDTKTEL